MNVLLRSYLQYHHRLLFERCTTNTNARLRYINTSSRSSIKSAIHILNLSDTPNFNPRELRDAYFIKAKLCHPDSSSRRKSSDDGKLVPVNVHKRDSATHFHKVNEAYDLLRKHISTSSSSKRCSSDEATTNANDNDNNNDNDNDVYYDDDIFHYIISKSEEQWFRDACHEYLGVDAETVEESKKCPVFREWLKGRSHLAFHWNIFLMQYGGLAPMLNKKRLLQLSEGGEGGRRRKKRHNRKI